MATSKQETPSKDEAGLAGRGAEAAGRSIPKDSLDSLVARIARQQDKAGYQDLHWEGSFEDYLRIVRDNPRVTRTAFQRIYDMILSHGQDRVHRQQEEAHPLQLLPRREVRRHATPSSASTSR